MPVPFIFFDPHERNKEKQAARETDYAILRENPGALAEIVRKNFMFDPRKISPPTIEQFPEPEEEYDPQEWARAIPKQCTPPPKI